MKGKFYFISDTLVENIYHRKNVVKVSKMVDLKIILPPWESFFPISYLSLMFLEDFYFTLSWKIKMTILPKLQTLSYW